MKKIPIKPIDKVGFMRYSTFNIEGRRRDDRKGLEK